MADFFQTTNTGSLQRYTIANIYVNGSVLIEETAISIERDTNSHSIHTIGVGYAGEAAGSPFITIMVDNAVPSTNFEIDPEKFFGQMQRVQFTVNAANKHLSFKGHIISDNFVHAVNTSAKLSFKAKGQISSWE